MPLAKRLTLIDVGRRPSWSSLSSHTLVPETSVVSGVCVLVIVKLLADVCVVSEV